MSQKEDEAQAAHHGFSVAAHNRAMDILYDVAPSQEETESLLVLAHVAQAKEYLLDQINRIEPA